MSENHIVFKVVIRFPCQTMCTQLFSSATLKFDWVITWEMCLYQAAWVNH